MAINPYQALGALLARETMLKNAFDIPAFQPTAPAPEQMSQEQISAMLNNIKSYPIEQQQKIYDAINQQFGASSYAAADKSKGILGQAWSGLTGQLEDWRKGLLDKYRSGMGSISQNLFGTSNYDPTAQSRYRSNIVLQNAAQNPEMYKAIQQSLKGVVPAQPAVTPSTVKPAPSTPAGTTEVPGTPTLPELENEDTVAASAGYPVTSKAKAPSTAPASVPVLSAKPKSKAIIEGMPADEWFAAAKQKGSGTSANEIARSVALSRAQATPGTAQNRQYNEMLRAKNPYLT
jgi:hypothetical protein